jgi:NitT/TauT family transport system ATP-binding protein
VAVASPRLAAASGPAARLPPVLQAVAVTLGYVGDRGAVTAVEGLSLEVRSGERLMVLGRSGCGKSTLLKAVAGFLQPTAGRILLGGREIRGAAPGRVITSTSFTSPMSRTAIRTCCRAA